jgi:hypothetical protein
MTLPEITMVAPKHGVVAIGCRVLNDQPTADHRFIKVVEHGDKLYTMLVDERLTDMEAAILLEWYLHGHKHFAAPDKHTMEPQ